MIRVSMQTAARTQPSPRIDLPRWLAMVLVIALLLGAWFIRINRLATIPPGVESDTTYDLGEAVRLMHGVPLPLAFATRQEPAHRYMLAAWLWLTGPHMFTARLLQGIFGILTVAMAYRAARIILKGQAFARLGALVAAGALASIVAHLFLSRTHYRVILVPLVALIAASDMLRAAQTQQRGRWLWSGAASGLGQHTYIAGMMTSVWFVGFMIHQLLFPVGVSRRTALKHTLYGLAGLAILNVPWLLLVSTVPDLYSRVRDVAPTDDLPLPVRLLNGMLQAASAFYAVGYYHPLYNTNDTPFLNPILAALAFAGLLLAIWRWRQPHGALLIGGLLAFMLPGALSREPTHSTRLVGTMPMLALLAGWGAAWLATMMVRVFSVVQSRTGKAMSRSHQTPIYALYIVVIAILGGSLASARAAYFAHFANPALYANPGYWLSIPHNYTLAYTEALERLAEVEEPTYVPVWALDSPAAVWVLQREAFPTVTTWVRYGLTDLPEGQIFFPTYNYYHNPAPLSDPQMALLLPDQDTIILLPPAPDGSPVIAMPEEGESAELWDSERRWVIARIEPRAAAALPPSALSIHGDTPTFGDGLHLIDLRAPAGVRPGEDVTV